MNCKCGNIYLQAKKKGGESNQQQWKDRRMQINSKVTVEPTLVNKGGTLK
jgi:hypothetical protein